MKSSESSSRSNSRLAESSSSSGIADDNITAILQPYFEVYTSKEIVSLIKAGAQIGDDGKVVNEDGYKNIISYLCVAINAEREVFLEAVLNKLYPTGRPEQESLQAGYDVLDKVSQYCSAIVDKESELWKSCRDSRLSQMSDEGLQQKIGHYFKNETAKFLQENYREAYAEALKLLNETPSSSRKSPSNPDENLTPEKGLSSGSRSPVPAVVGPDSRMSPDSHESLDEKYSTLQGR